MLDLSAAFDTIDHNTLLQRLEHLFGIKNKPLQWISSYLSNRYQTVCIDGELSKPVLMKFSVPQGSVLGPKYYTMYTKPVGSICKNHGLSHHFYADDSQLYLSFKPTDNVAHTVALCLAGSCLNDIVAWCMTICWNLKLRQNWTYCLRISTQGKVCWKCISYYW